MTMTAVYEGKSVTVNLPLTEVPAELLQTFFPTPVKAMMEAAKVNLPIGCQVPLYLDYRTVLDALKRAVADRGEQYVYNPHENPVNGSAPCLYWHSDEKAPGCLVGLALYQLGVPAEVLESFGTASIKPLSGLLPGMGMYITPDAVRLLSSAQYQQDRGVPWGQALRLALLETGGEGSCQPTNV